MPRPSAPEVITGARGERGPSTVTLVAGPEEHPQVATRQLKPEQAHFVSRYREYAIVVYTEPDHVNSTGQIVKGINKTVRFRDFNLITADPLVIDKIRAMGRSYGLGREVWEKYQQDEDLAQKALSTAESAIDGLPPEMQEKLLGRLQARFESFKLTPRTQPVVGSAPAAESDEEAEPEYGEPAGDDPAPPDDED